ncbi:MAG TPA: N-acetylglutaminylglutamine amidotransferase [Gammaproteobacteria bacterium]|nr:N-acetylglutaminylglutamine amidotransferase [Gammaproteobacteria bacterium]
MCGICGEFRFDDHPPDLGGIARMAGSLASRGPDGEGAWRQGPVAFGHRLLSIMDLAPPSRQPMVDAELGLAIVFNGAIYNFPELREELIGLGYRFFSKGDTEVLLKAYHAWGEDFVQRLNGMFAFAIHERDSGRMLLGRDRLGIKPLYYCPSVPGRPDSGLRFASSLPALLAGGLVDTSIDPEALNFYLSFHAVVPAPWTILKGVRKLPPATLLRIEPDGTRRERRYWNPGYDTPADAAERTPEEWEAQVLEALRAATARRLVAEVPVGVLLSGGLDSSLLVGLLSEAGQHGLNTFSVGFESVGDVQGDEFKYSDIIARHFETEHHKLFVDSAQLLPALTDTVQAMSEPMVSHDVVGFYLLSREVSRHVRVVQSGQGADEVFGGYHWYPPLLESTDPLADYARVFFDRDYADYCRLVSPAVRAEDKARALVAEHFAAPGAGRPIDKALRLDTQVMLVDDPVKRVDNMTMAWGLEARVPFLDHELVELAAQVPAELKICDGGKGILKRIGRRIIPAEVIDRPKGYFPVPALKHLRGDYLALVRDVLDAQAARERGLFQRPYLDTLFAAPDEHITSLGGSKLWQAALLEFWLQSHGI